MNLLTLFHSGTFPHVVLGCLVIFLFQSQCLTLWDACFLLVKKNRACLIGKVIVHLLLPGSMPFLEITSHTTDHLSGLTAYIHSSLSCDNNLLLSTAQHHWRKKGDWLVFLLRKKWLIPMFQKLQLLLAVIDFEVAAPWESFQHLQWCMPSVFCAVFFSRVLFYMNQIHLLPFFLICFLSVMNCCFIT